MATLELKESEEGNNYVHELIKTSNYENPEDVARQLVEYLAEMPKTDVIRILNEQNNYGNTPLLELLSCQEPNDKILAYLISSGSDVNMTDSLGMSPLYKITEKLFIPQRILNGQFLGEDEKRIVHEQTSHGARILKLLLQSGADVNKADIFGRTPLFLANDIEVIQLFKEYGGDLCRTDRCGRTLLHSAFSMPNCEFLVRFFISSITPSVVQKPDIFGSTPLHYAALLDKQPVFDELIRNGANKNATDCKGDTPISALKRMHTNEGIIYERTPENKRRFFASKKSDEVHFLEIMGSKDLSVFLKKAESVSQVISLLNGPGFGAPCNLDESESIKTAIVCFAHRLCETIGKMDGRLKCTLFRTGSSEEGTKVGDPFEFDFVFCLDWFAELCHVVESENKKGFAELKISDRVPTEFAKFFDTNGKCNATKVRFAFGKVLRRLVTDKDTWADHHIYFDGDVQHNEEYDRPVFTLKVRWIGCAYKYQEISIDICPAVRQVGWWPSGTDFNSIDMMTPEIRGEGCLLLLQNPYFESETLLRISCSPADIYLMKSIPSVFRESYRLCKLLRHEKLCPLMDVDATSDYYPLFEADDSITSYMLKNCLFHILGDYRRSNTLKEVDGPERDEAIVGVAVKLLRFLDQCLLKEKLPVYFLQNREDIFRFQFVEIDRMKEEEVQKVNNFHCTRRRAFLKMMRYHLGQKL